MSNIRETAKAYESPKTPTVAELEALSLDTPIEEKTGKDKNGKAFSYKVAIVTGREFRVPSSVLKDIKALLAIRPNTKTVRIVKQGTGMDTSYTVVPLE